MLASSSPEPVLPYSPPRFAVGLVPLVLLNFCRSANSGVSAAGASGLGLQIVSALLGFAGSRRGIFSISQQVTSIATVLLLFGAGTDYVSSWLAFRELLLTEDNTVAMRAPPYALWAEPLPLARAPSSRPLTLIALHPGLYHSSLG